MTRKSSQGILNLPLATKPTTCKICGMNFYSYIEKDASVHSRYHYDFVNGPRCDIEVGKNATLCHSFRIISSGKSMECSILCINKANSRLVKRVEVLLEMVNRELVAPAANSFWKQNSDTGVTGQAFVAVLDRRIVGLCVTEPIISIEKQSRWIVDRTQGIVPNQVNRKSKIGISRIWVASKWRRRGIAQSLLEGVLNNLIYGVALQKSEIAFSQPSHAGGKLARQFNGVRHKSGELLVPIYLE